MKESDKTMNSENSLVNNISLKMDFEDFIIDELCSMYEISEDEAESKLLNSELYKRLYTVDKEIYPYEFDSYLVELVKEIEIGE